VKRPLRIGINAIFRGKPSGTPNYIIHLVRSLQRLDKENEYRVFVTADNRHYFDGLDEGRWRAVTCDVDAASPLRRRLWEQTRFRQIIRSQDLDLLHCPINVLPMALPCKSVVTFLDCQYFSQESTITFARREFHKFFMRTSARQADAVLTISHSMKEEIARYMGRWQPNVCVAHLGQDFTDVPAPGPVETRAALSRAGITRPFILFIGYPHLRKNLTGLLRAFAACQDRLPEPFELVFCGDFETPIESDYPNMLKTAADLAIGDAVRFVNYPSKADLCALLHEARLMAFPSFYEGFGLPVIEAMACGTPVFVSDIPVMHEIAGDAGFYVDPHDVGNMSDGLLRLLSDAALCRDLSSRGREIAAGFTWDSTALETLACYRRVCGLDPTGSNDT
jgi:alpha-1,3-rhamnosyl/mannosyltransferase